MSESPPRVWQEHECVFSDIHSSVVYAVWQLIETPREDGISPYELAQLMNECMAARPDDLWEGK